MAKLTKSHSTAIPAVKIIYDKLASLDAVSKASYGIINQCKPVRGQRRVKIVKETGCYLLKVRDIGSVQDLRIYATDADFDKVIMNELQQLGFEVKV